MTYKPVVTLIAALTLLTGCDQMQSSSRTETTTTGSTAAPAVTGEVVAIINGTPISRDVLNLYASQRKAQPGSEEANTEEAVLNELISLELMRQDGVNKGLDQSPIVVATIDQQARTALAGAAIKAYMTDNPVSDEEAKRVYDEQMGAAGKEYNARHILVEDEATAKDVIKMLDNGKDFSELAKEKSTGPSGPSGGKLGWFSPGQMVQPFSDAAAALEKGSYTSEPVQTQFGWHVIILDDVRDSTPPPYDDVKDRIKILLANQQLQQYVETMKANSAIEIK